MPGKKSVAIIGGGVAGLSVAHELLARSGHGVDFTARVFERRADRPGGKARSIPVPSSGTDGRRDLPGEHGFRFFPGFYRHLPDTMKTIPTADRRSVFDHLVDAPRLELARSTGTPIVASARFPRSLRDLETVLHTVFGMEDLGLKPGELEMFAGKLWRVLTSCQDRRIDEYEKMSWWEYLDADAKERSPAYRHLLAIGLSRSLLANDPKRASARTVGDTNVQLLLDIVEPGVCADRVLDGPTSEVWIEPWRRHLETAYGSAFSLRMGAEATRIHCAGQRICSVTVATPAGDEPVEADYYVFAVPVEKMARLLTVNAAEGGEHPLRFDPVLRGVVELAQHVAWMNGIQFFLYEDVPIVRGHVLFVDSPWALTAVSEAQFWRGVQLGDRGDGKVHGILSVCLSDWDAPGLNGRPANQCSRHEIVDEVWAQLKNGLNVAGRVVLEDRNVHSSFMDPDIEDRPQDRKDRYRDAEPLLVNVANSWSLRPDAYTRIPNMFLASDYLQTNTDVACMEGANEAARRAVNCILDAAGSRASACEIWSLHEPALLAPLRWTDQRRWDRGLPWSGALL